MHDAQEVYLSDSIISSYKQILSHVRSIYESDKSSTFLTCQNVKFCTKLQLIFSLKYKDAQSSVFELLLTHALNAEKSAAGGFDRFFELVLSDIDNEQIRERLKSFKVSGQKRSKRADVETLINSRAPNIANMLNDALDLSGLNGTIAVEKSKTNQRSVELIDGYNFKLKAEFKVNKHLTDVNIMCIDGFIESVSEINRMLESCHSCESHSLLFTRGMNDDVLNTLKINYDRGTLRVIPFIVPYDVEGVHLLSDISVLAGSQLINLSMGRMINNLSIDDFTKIDMATLCDDKIVLVNSKSRETVKKYVDGLRKQRSQLNDDVGNFIDLRIKSLLPSKVIIRLPDDENFIIQSQMIDNVLRGIKSLTTYGVLDDKSAAVEIASLISVLKFKKLITSLGAIVKN